MYKVLVTNDDGINSIGIQRLVKELSKLAVVYVVAPTNQQSGKSMSLTTEKTIKAEKVTMDGAEEAYSFDGTPVDCVKWGISRFRETVDFDYLISGINRGYNLGSTSYYSGTVGAAREGIFSGIKSIALSVEHHDATEFDFICNMLPELFELSNQVGTSTLLNVNAPDEPAWKIKGVKVVEAAPSEYGDCYGFVSDGEEYKLEPYFSKLDESLENDFNALSNGYVAITPLSVELTNKSVVKKLRGVMMERPVCVFMDSQADVFTSMHKPKRWQSNIIRWAKCVNRLDVPALLAEQYGHGETLPEISECLDKHEVITKVDFNALNSKEFEDLVSASTKREVYLAGLETHISIQQTALSLVENGYKVSIIEDCCTAKTKQDHEIAIENMKTAGCRITTLEAVVMELLQNNLHSAYNTLREII